MGRKGKTAHSAQDVIKAIQGTAGVKSHIAKKLGVARSTLDSYLERWATVREAYDEEKAGVSDAARSVVINDIVNNRNVDTAKWWLRMKESEEFGDKSKVEHSGGLTIALDWGDNDTDND